MQNVLLVVQLILAIALIGVVLVQRSAQDGGGLTGGGTTMGGLFTARGSANLLTRTTAVLATLFILNCIVLGAMASRSTKTGSLIDQIEPVAPTEQTAPQAPAKEAPKGEAPAPQVPLAR